MEASFGELITLLLLLLVVLSLATLHAVFPATSQAAGPTASTTDSAVLVITAPTFT